MKLFSLLGRLQELVLDTPPPNSKVKQFAPYGNLKTKKKFKCSALQVVVVVYKRWYLTGDSKYSDLTGKLLIFSIGKLVTEERWLLMRGGCLQPEV